MAETGTVAHPSINIRKVAVEFTTRYGTCPVATRTVAAAKPSGCEVVKYLILYLQFSVRKSPILSFSCIMYKYILPPMTPRNASQTSDSLTPRRFQSHLSQDTQEPVLFIR